MAQHRSIYSSDDASSSSSEDDASSSSSEDDETRPPSPPEEQAGAEVGAWAASDWQEHAGDETEGETEGETDEDGSSTPGSGDADGDDHRPATEEADMKRHVAELVVARCPRSALRDARASDALCPSPLQNVCTHARMEQAAENEECRALISQLELEREQLWAAVANEREEHRVQIEREREFEKQKLVDLQVQLFCPEQPNRT